MVAVAIYTMVYQRSRSVSLGLLSENGFIVSMLIAKRIRTAQSDFVSCVFFIGDDCQQIYKLIIFIPASTI